MGFSSGADFADALSRVRNWPTARSKVWLEALLVRAANDPGVKAVVAIGSSISSASTSADLDIVVVCDNPGVLQAGPPIEVDLRVFPSNEVDAAIASGNDLVGWAVVYGTVLCDRGDFWSKLLHRWGGKVPLPAPGIYQGRASVALRRVGEMLAAGDVEAAQEYLVSYVTHLARGELVEHGVYPASRPELSEQLRSVGCTDLAKVLEVALITTEEEPAAPKIEALARRAGRATRKAA